MISPELKYIVAQNSEYCLTTWDKMRIFVLFEGHQTVVVMVNISNVLLSVFQEIFHMIFFNPLL